MQQSTLMLLFTELRMRKTIGNISTDYSLNSKHKLHKNYTGITNMNSKTITTVRPHKRTLNIQCLALKISEHLPLVNRHDAYIRSVECEAQGIMGRYGISYQDNKKSADYVIVANLPQRRVKVK